MTVHRATFLALMLLTAANGAEQGNVRRDRAQQVLRMRVLPLKTSRSRHEIRPGDTVRVTDRRARLMRETNVVAPLSLGQRIYVTQLEGPWVGGHVVVGGEMRRGWVQSRQVAFEAEELRLETVPQVESSAPFVSAAMLLEKARRFDHGLLATLVEAANRKQIPQDDPVQAWIRQASPAAHAPFAQSCLAGLQCELLKYAPDDGSERDILVELATRGRDAPFDWPPGNDWRGLYFSSLAPLVSPRGAPEREHVTGADTWNGHLLALARAQIALPAAPLPKQIVAEFPQDYPAVPFPDEDDVVILRPQLSVEPLPSVYHRRALGYRLLRELLTAALEQRAATPLRRQLDGEAPHEPLIVQLRRMESLLLGASLVSAQELGLLNFPPEATEQDARTFRNWTALLAEDPDIGRDRRTMTVIATSTAGQTRVRAMAGWAARTLEVTFAQPPAVHIAGGSQPSRRPQFDARAFVLWEPVWIEFDVPRVLDQATFRTLCDAYRTRLAIETACQQYPAGR